MKPFRLSIALLAMFALTFTSCSKEETDSGNQDQEKIQLTFGSILNDMNNDLNKQATPGECTEGDPAYVQVGITDDLGNYIGEDGGTTAVNLVEVGLRYNTSLNVYETVYSEELALPAGEYQLQYFIVYNEDDEVLWVAPRLEGSFEDFVDNPLPQEITLIEGTKPYITVDVLCYVSRNVEAYGYVFFDINLNRVENGYCIFVNYCDDGTGREYPAYFEIEVWSDDFDGTPVTLTSDRNTVSMAGAYASASVLCFALPDLGEDTYYARVTVLDHDLLPYDSNPETDFFEFTITQDDIEDQLLAVPAYEHVRFNCEPPYGEPTCEPGSLTGDTNGDCVVDCRDTNSCEPNDPCPEEDVNGDCIVDCKDTNSCESPRCADSAYMIGNYDLKFYGNNGGKNWGWGLSSKFPGSFVDGYYDAGDERWEFPFIAGAENSDGNTGWEAGRVYVTINGKWLTVEIDLHDGVTMTDSNIWFSDDGRWPRKLSPDKFDLNTYSFKVDGRGNYSLIVHGEDLCHEGGNY